jgi:hypothetical protein
VRNVEVLHRVKEDMRILHAINPLNAELNPICHLLALLGGATIVVVSRLRVKRRQVDWIGQTLRMDFLLQHFIKGKIEVRT